MEQHNKQINETFQPSGEFNIPGWQFYRPHINRIKLFSTHAICIITTFSIYNFILIILQIFRVIYY
jgi:hypothetical protein